MRGSRRWSLTAALLLAGGLALPAQADQRGGGVCSPLPSGCRRDDCRCEDKETCTQCRQFVCRRGKKKPPVVVCRPCCKDKKGYPRCRPAPEEDDRKCVLSPS